MSGAVLAGTVGGLVRSRAHPGCAACDGTGVFRYTRTVGVPCPSCVMHSEDCEPELHGPDCPTRRLDEDATEEELRAWDAEPRVSSLAHLSDGRLAMLARQEVSP